jgi:hypothetical protein
MSRYWQLVCEEQAREYWESKGVKMPTNGERWKAMWESFVELLRKRP